MSNETNNLSAFLTELASSAQDLDVSRNKIPKNLVHIIKDHIVKISPLDVFQDFSVSNFNDDDIELLMQYLFRANDIPKLGNHHEIFSKETMFVPELLFLLSLSIIDKFKEISYADLVIEIISSGNYNRFTYLNNANEITTKMLDSLASLHHFSGNLAIDEDLIDWKINNQKILPNNISVKQEDFLQLLYQFALTIDLFGIG